MYEPNLKTDSVTFAGRLLKGQWFRPLTPPRPWPRDDFAQLRDTFTEMNNNSVRRVRLRGFFVDGYDAVVWAHENDVVLVKRPGHEPQPAPPPADDTISRAESERIIRNIELRARAELLGASGDLRNQIGDAFDAAISNLTEYIDRKIVTEIRKGQTK